MPLMKSIKHMKSCWLSSSTVHNKPWGVEHTWSALGSLQGKLLFISSNERTSLKYNTLKDECLYVLNGIIEVEYGSEGSLVDPVQYPFKKSTISNGECFNVQSGCPYRIKALSDGAQVIEISEKKFNSRTIRLEDDYGRE
jgi:mannose-6-phosphate isomerase-like protein (cupin superfamily)